jgi:indole-3-glycerol phosphate synthase
MKTGTILDQIVADKRIEVASRKAARRRQSRAASPRAAVGRFRRALSGPGVAMIAEIKGASPAAGTIRTGFDPVSVARAYEAGGAAALSVLTDAKYFGGSWDALAAVCRSSPLPVLCKEFIIDPDQIDDAAEAGAAAVLLITAILDSAHLEALRVHARQCGLDALVEVHAAEEAATAVAAGADIIGINNRDLATLRVDLETTARLRPLVPPGVVVVAESGYETRDQVVAVERLGVHAVLIGRSLMASADPAGKLRELRGA